MNNGNLTEQSEVIKSIDNAAYIENHVSPYCQIDGMSASEYARINTLHQIEIARLNATIERQKAEKLAMQVELDMEKRRLDNIGAVISDFKEPMTKQSLCGLIVQIQRHLREVVV